MKQLTLLEKQQLFSYNVGKLLVYAYEVLNIKITLGEAYRTIYQQQKYLAEGKTKTLNSKHLYKLAIDLNVFINGQINLDKNAYKELALYWKSLHENNDCGYFWGWDYNHFEMK